MREILLRILLVIISIVLAFYFFPITVHEFVTNQLGYHKPPGFFGFTLADWGITWLLSFNFLAGILLGTLGKKKDYILLLVLLLLSFIDLFTTENITPITYLALLGSSFIGNVIGFALKLLRRRIWGR